MVALFQRANDPRTARDIRRASSAERQVGGAHAPACFDPIPWNSNMPPRCHRRAAFALPTHTPLSALIERKNGGRVERNPSGAMQNSETTLALC
jgi:hypothetical protein